MKLTVDHVILSFLQAEAKSTRFAKYIGHADNIEKLLFLPDLSDPAENEIRRNLLAAYRGFGNETMLGTGLHVDSIEWTLETVPYTDHHKFKTVKHKHWDALTEGTRRVYIGAQNVTKFQLTPDTDVILSITRDILNRLRFAPPICVEHRGDLYIIEGNKRITAALVVGVPSITVIVGRGDVADWTERQF